MKCSKTPPMEARGGHVLNKNATLPASFFASGEKSRGGLVRASFFSPETKKVGEAEAGLFLTRGKKVGRRRISQLTISVKHNF